MNRRTRPSLSGGFALAAVTVLVCLLLGEAVSRLSDPEASLWRYPNYIWQATEIDDESPLQLRYDSELGYEPRPGVSGTLKGETLSYSADGFRNHNLDRPTATGPLILALGDSYTEGYAVSDDETWPAHLERDTGRRVLNAGVRSYGLDQIVLRAERLVPRVKPRTMVLAFIESDIGRTALLARELRFKPYFVPAGQGLELRNVPVPTERACPAYRDGAGSGSRQGVNYRRRPDGSLVAAQVRATATAMVATEMPAPTANHRPWSDSSSGFGGCMDCNPAAFSASSICSETFMSVWA